MGRSPWIEIGKVFEAAGIASDWLPMYYDRFCCPSCKALLPEHAGRSIDLVLDEPPPRGHPLNMAAPTGRLIVHRKLDEALDEFVDDYVGKGRVLGPDGRQYDGFVTWTPRFVVALRAGPHSRRDVCPVCCALHYCPVPFMETYIVTRDLCEQRRVYVSDQTALIVHEDVLPRLESLKGFQKRMLTGRRIPVKEIAEDGIQDFPRRPI